MELPYTIQTPSFETVGRIAHL